MSDFIDEMLAKEPIAEVYEKIGQSLRYDVTYINMRGQYKDRRVMISKEDWEAEVLPNAHDMLIDELDKIEGCRVGIRWEDFVSDDENVEDDEVCDYYLQKMSDADKDADDNDIVYIQTIVTDWYNKNIG